MFPSLISVLSSRSLLRVSVPKRNQAVSPRVSDFIDFLELMFSKAAKFFQFLFYLCVFESEYNLAERTRLGGTVFFCPRF